MRVFLIFPCYEGSSVVCVSAKKSVLSLCKRETRKTELQDCCTEDETPALAGSLAGTAEKPSPQPPRCDPRTGTWHPSAMEGSRVCSLVTTATAETQAQMMRRGRKQYH